MNDIVYKCFLCYVEIGLALGFCAGVWGFVLWQYAELQLCSMKCVIKNNHGDVFEFTPGGQDEMLLYFSEHVVLGRGVKTFFIWPRMLYVLIRKPGYWIPFEVIGTS